MYEIDSKRIQGDTTLMILSNISEQLTEIIAFLKPQEAKEEAKQVQEVKLYKCKKCGQNGFETPQKLAIHTRHCKG
jgi:hypothetical protein